MTWADMVPGMSNVRWNFRLGPIAITSWFGAISWGIVGAALLVCCCGGVVGAIGDDDQPTRPVVTPSLLSTTASTALQQVAPSPTRSPVVKSSPTPKRTTSKPKPSPTAKKPTPKDDPRYDTCAEANANGYGPYVEGEDPEYDWYRDRDGDGIVCEPA